MTVAHIAPTHEGCTLMDVLVVDHHRVVADAIATRLRLESDVDRVSTAGSTDEALRAAEWLRPAVITIDLELGPDNDWETAASAVRAGALGLVFKDAPADELVSAVRGVAAGEARIPPKVLTAVLRALREPTPRHSEWDARVARLTRREREVLHHMVAGHDRATTARDLYVSVNTVRTHAKNILAKLEVHSTLEAVGVALNAGMRPPAAD
jgi:DNA-binding NarL/FixJ family response regulator